MRAGYEDCDCLEQDVDILTGISSCFNCGRTRWLSDEELLAELQFRAEVDQAYAEEMEKADAILAAYPEARLKSEATRSDEVSEDCRDACLTHTYTGGQA